MDDKRLIKTSKYLARHLRHDPARLGLTLHPGGWVEVDALLEALAARSFALSRLELLEVVARNDKRRFSLDATGTRIRANQGHSIKIDLQLARTAPPRVLYHGTSRASVGSIMQDGLRREGRHHVHLSSNVPTALGVGRRHGRPLVLEVDASRMAAEGHDFYLTENGVWLTLAVPPEFLAPRWELS